MAANDATLFLDRDLRLRRFTPPIRDYFDVQESDIGQPIGEVARRLGYHELAADAQHVLDARAPIEREVQDRPDQQHRIQIRPYRTVEGAVEGVAIRFVGPPGQQHIEDELREAKTYAESIVDTVREGLIVLDNDLRVQSASASFYETFQAPPEQTEGRLIYELGNGQWDIPELHRLLEDVLPDNNIFNGYKITHQFEHIGERTMMLNARRLDHVQKILLAIEDVTEREKAKTEATAATFRQLFENLPGLYLIVEPDDYEIVAVSNAYLRATKTERTEIIGKTFFEVLPPNSTDSKTKSLRRLRTSLRKVKKERQPDVMPVTRYPVSHPGAENDDAERPDSAGDDVKERWWSAVNSPVFNASGEIDYIIHRTEDVTPVIWKLQAESEEDLLDRLDARESHLTMEVILRGQELQEAREEAYKRLRENEQRFRAIVESATEYAIITLDLDGRVTMWNAGAKRLLGWTEEEIVGEDSAVFFIPEDREAGDPEQEMHKALTTGRTENERWHIRKDGSRFWGSGLMWPFRDSSGTVTGFLKIFRDRTAEREAKKALEEFNETLEKRVERRTAQVRELASQLTMTEQKERRRLSHILHDDLQQRLYGIQMRMTFLRKHAESDTREQLLEHVQQAEDWMNEAIVTTRQLSVDLHPPVLKQDGLVEALGWLQTQMQEMHGLDVEIETEHAFYLPDQNMRVLLFQAVRELLFNVVKHAGTDRATVTLDEEAEYVVIRVYDEGRGFDPIQLEEQSYEEGFGLTAVRERLELFGGGLQIESAPDEGTRMTLRAPLKQYRAGSALS